MGVSSTILLVFCGQENDLQLCSPWCLLSGAETVWGFGPFIIDLLLHAQLKLKLLPVTGCKSDMFLMGIGLSQGSLYDGFCNFMDRNSRCSQEIDYIWL